MLHDMARCDLREKAEALLEHGAEIDAVDDEYLGLAARAERDEMVSWFLERGADVNKAGTLGDAACLGAKARTRSDRREADGGAGAVDRLASAASDPLRNLSNKKLRLPTRNLP